MSHVTSHTSESDRIVQLKRFGLFDPQKELDEARTNLLSVQSGLDSSTQLPSSGDGATVAPDTAGDTGFNFTFGDNRGIDKTIEDLLNEAGGAAGATVDEDEIRSQTLSRFQDEIDATNIIFDDLTSDARERGQSREGSGRAIRFSQGLGGSQRGETQRENILDINKEEKRSIQAERAARIGVIMGNVRSSALKRITEEREAKQQGAASYLELIKLQDERRDTGVNEVVDALIAQGVTFDDLSNPEVQELTKNLQVNAEKLQTAYLDATADTRASEQASSREAAIVSLRAQGITDPTKLFDLINFNEAGERVGDISVEEITGVLDDLEVDEEDNTFTLSQGQKKFEINEDGSVSEIAFNPKTFAPKDGDESDPEILTFDEWKETDTAKEILGEEQEKQNESFGAEKADEVLRSFYNQAVSETQASSSLKKLSNTDKGALQQSGLESSTPQAQSFFLNTSSKFKDYYSQQVALGNVERNASVEDVNELLELFEQQEEEDDSDDLDQLLSALRGG